MFLCISNVRVGKKLIQELKGLFGFNLFLYGTKPRAINYEVEHFISYQEELSVCCFLCLFF